MEPGSQVDAIGQEKSVAQPIGLVGLGLMGMALSDRLLGGGFAVRGYDIDPGRDDLLRRAGGEPASGAAETAFARNRILLGLPDSDVVEAVLDGMRSSLAAGRVLVDASTGDPGRAAAMGRQLAERGICYLDNSAIIRAFECLGARPTREREANT